jgi:aminodeoxyfutalosine deaminase
VNGDFILRARIVWLVSQPPIDDGAILVSNGRIAQVGTWRELSNNLPGETPVEDLGEVALIPGLVNAHCHLDYSGMAGLIPPPSNFPDWIKAILQIKAHWSYSEFAASWVKGARQLLDSGVTTVGDIEAVPELLPDSWDATPLRMVSFFEMTGVRSQNSPDRILSETMRHVHRAGRRDTKRTGLSPHALYSTPPALVRFTASLVQHEGLPVTTHLAESREEWEMFRNAGGSLYNWLKTQRNMEDCGDKSPIQQAHHLGLLQPAFIAVHANHLAPGDAELLAANRCHVVHCPRSHQYFRHEPFPFSELTRAGVNICLGTDSLASILPRDGKGKIPTLNLWDEMQTFASLNPDVPPNRIVEMATLNGACALGLDENHADLIAIAYEGSPEALPDVMVHSAPTILRRWIAGAPTANSK